MKNPLPLVRVMMIMNLFLLFSAHSAFSAEFVQMKAQGYQPVITPEEANRRVELGLNKEDMVPLEDGGLGRRTYLEKTQAVSAKASHSSTDAAGQN